MDGKSQIASTFSDDVNDNIGFANKPSVHIQNSVPGDELVTVEKGYTNFMAELPPAEGKRALRKVDYRLIPLLAVFYLVNYVDRSNIGNAEIAGLGNDLNLEGWRYNVVYMILPKLSF